MLKHRPAELDPRERPAEPPSAVRDGRPQPGGTDCDTEQGAERGRAAETESVRIRPGAAFAVRVLNLWTSKEGSLTRVCNNIWPELYYNL